MMNGSIGVIFVPEWVTAGIIAGIVKPRMKKETQSVVRDRMLLGI